MLCLRSHPFGVDMNPLQSSFRCKHDSLCVAELACSNESLAAGEHCRRYRRNTGLGRVLEGIDGTLATVQF